MLSPKRVKHRKQHRGRMAGLTRAQPQVTFGEYGLKTLEAVGSPTVRSRPLVSR